MLTKNLLILVSILFSPLPILISLSFPMQPLYMLRNSIEFNLGSFKAKVTFKSEGSRVLTTIGEEDLLENNYLDNISPMIFMDLTS